MSSINEKVKQQYGNSVGVIKTTPEAERNFKEAHQKYKEALEAIGRKTE